jgi:hypothetical protein
MNVLSNIYSIKKPELSICVRRYFDVKVPYILLNILENTPPPGGRYRLRSFGGGGKGKRKRGKIKRKRN